MNNNTNTKKFNETLKLTLIRGTDSYQNAKAAKQAVKRLLSTAALLPSLSFISWQLTAKQKENRVFSACETSVTVEDYGWIFEDCAVVTDGAGEPDDLFAPGRRVYALTAKNSVPADPFDDPFDFAGEPVTADQVRDMIGMLSEAGAIVRICILPESGVSAGRGVIFISLPCEMPLRMKSMISMVLTDTSVTEVYAPEFSRDIRLTENTVTDCAVKLLSALMYDGGTQETCRDGDGGTIDSLGLGVRAYNCLKRAGITSIARLRELTDEDFASIRNLGTKAADEIKRKLAAYRGAVAAARTDCTDHMAALDRLIGLEAVKEQIKKAAALAKMKKAFAEQGRGELPVSLHMAFVGNPGTAKTTVARLAAGIFCEIGLLTDPAVIEVGRADLVAKYVGQTAAQVRDVFCRAKGKVLFIDEAYSLIDDRESCFGDEAIHTIVAEMENRRSDTVVIFAGYPDKMEAFFERNPGLRSRVPFFIRFRDYSDDEMIKICDLEARDRGFEIDADAYEKIRLLCSEDSDRREAGNGRLCRNIVEAAILNYAERNYGDGRSGGSGGFILTADDFTSCGASGSDRPGIGFCA
ncbi:MAG: AAA family ATPase [Clostridia bacterium]|nr:AAA family ATPase [Clostridia bacterium]